VLPKATPVAQRLRARRSGGAEGERGARSGPGEEVKQLCVRSRPSRNFSPGGPRLRRPHQAASASGRPSDLINTWRTVNAAPDLVLRRRVLPPVHRLMYRAIEKLVALAKAPRHTPVPRAISGWPSRAAIMIGRYSHAHQFRRARRMLRFLRTWLGWLIRDVGARSTATACSRPYSFLTEPGQPDPPSGS
jgi:hypothetical protein